MINLPRSRGEARLTKSRFYFTGLPCKNGHIAIRHIVDGGCKTCKYERDKFRRLSDPEAACERVKRHYSQNSEKIRARRRAHHHATYPEREDFRVAAQERVRAWAKANPDRARANHRNGKARRRNVLGLHTAEDVARIFKMQRGRCAYCRQQLPSKFEVDHIQPIAKGGTNDARNIQLSCGKCNREKAAKDPITYAQMLGRLI